MISIHAPREGSDTLCTRRTGGCRPISIHAPREGSDACRSLLFIRDMIFLSTLPARGATARPAAASTSLMISIHAPREGSDVEVLQGAGVHLGISIHAPREGSDLFRLFMTFGQPYFYPRSPRGERPGRRWAMAKVTIFLSTLPARGATARRKNKR